MKYLIKRYWLLVFLAGMVVWTTFEAAISADSGSTVWAFYWGVLALINSWNFLQELDYLFN